MRKKKKLPETADGHILKRGDEYYVIVVSMSSWRYFPLRIFYPRDGKEIIKEKTFYSIDKCWERCKEMNKRFEKWEKIWDKIGKGESYDND